jgi:uncharacterized membrane protein
MDRQFSGSEIGAIAHFYRGEVYRSTAWRSRLDNTTNWAVVTTGIALSLGYSDAEASALPLILVGLLVGVFLLLEARRYRYFNVRRARCRLLETDFFAPLVAVRRCLLAVEDGLGSNPACRCLGVRIL